MRYRFILGTILAGVGLATAMVAEAQWIWTPQTGRFINLKHLPKETPELQVEYVRTLLIDRQYSKAWREAEKFDKFYAESDYADDVQFLRGEIRMAQDKLTDAAKEFQQVISQHPDSELYDEVIAKQYAIGDQLYERGVAKQDKKWAFYKDRPFKKAIDVYSMVIENEPFTDAAAEAQYKVGLCHFTREEYIEAAFEYRRVIEDYGTSDWVDEAAYGLALCHYEASLRPEYDQTPSMLAIDAIDDFRERFPLDERGESLVAKRVEMRERIAHQRLQTAQFYAQRRQYHAAHVCYRALADEFSDTEAAKAAKTWLDENPLGQVEPGLVVPEVLRSGT
jgi:outer membrane assembly lipoprotein YfiO